MRNRYFLIVPALSGGFAILCGGTALGMDSEPEGATTARVEHEEKTRSAGSAGEIKQPHTALGAADKAKPVRNAQGASPPADGKPPQGKFESQSPRVKVGKSSEPRMAEKFPDAPRASVETTPVARFSTPRNLHQSSGVLSPQEHANTPRRRRPQHTSNGNASAPSNTAAITQGQTTQPPPINHQWNRIIRRKGHPQLSGRSRRESAPPPGPHRNPQDKGSGWRRRPSPRGLSSRSWSDTDRKLDAKVQELLKKSDHKEMSTFLEEQLRELSPPSGKERTHGSTRKILHKMAEHLYRQKETSEELKRKIQDKFPRFPGLGHPKTPPLDGSFPRFPPHGCGHGHGLGGRSRPGH